MNCDPIAKYYRWMEYAAFGSALRKRREAFLFELGDPQKVLVLGDGDGRFLQVFAALYPRAQIDAVDVSAKMVELAKARVPQAQFHIANALTFPFDKQYDLAVAHFFFDCLSQQELAQLLSRVDTKSWLISEFQYTGWSRPFIRVLYFFFRLTTGLKVTNLPNHQTPLRAEGFKIEKKESRSLLVSELWSRL